MATVVETFIIQTTASSGIVHNNTSGLNDGDYKHLTDTEYNSLVFQSELDLKADKTNVLELDNTSIFTPDSDYEPATKKYVDDNVSISIHGDLTGLLNDDHSQYLLLTGRGGQTITDALTLVGLGNTFATNALTVKNGDGVDMLVVRDDNRVDLSQLVIGGIENPTAPIHIADGRGIVAGAFLSTSLNTIGQYTTSLKAGHSGINSENVLEFVVSATASTSVVVLSLYGDKRAEFSGNLSVAEGATFNDSILMSSGNSSLDFKVGTAAFNIGDRFGMNRATNSVILYQDVSLGWTPLDSVSFDSIPDTEITRVSAGVLGMDSAVINGVGNTSATDALTVKNGDGVNMLVVRDDNQLITLGNGTIQLLTDLSPSINLSGNGQLNAASTLAITSPTVQVAAVTQHIVSTPKFVVDGNLWVNDSLRKKTTLVSSGTYSILATDNTIVVNYTTTDPVALELPSLLDAWDATTKTGMHILIKDIGINAGANNITISRKSTTTDTIVDILAGQVSTAVDSDGGAINLMAISALQWIVF